ncbi:hypothetical protein E6H36_05695 [Candidatus Bathyarchaeota archaeon]|nr:MAG: hypothetical protein E6H36_05695 [Candidatus Bathyarchaeota archaeon]
MKRPTIRVVPKTTMADRCVSINLQDFPPNEHVTLRATVTLVLLANGSSTFSSANYLQDPNTGI